jgi:hypothetical protein
MKKLLLGFVFLICVIPVNVGKGDLSNYGIKERSIGGTLTSKVADKILADRVYNRVELLVPFVKECAKEYNIPENVLLAILFEEALHRKPIDIQTFGVAQLGTGELIAQGLPPDPNLYSNDRFSVWMLARKLKRLQLRTGSLQTAITLHNGYYDYLPAIRKRASDPGLLQLLEIKKKRKTLVV